MEKRRKTWERLIQSDSLGIFDVHGVISDIMRVNESILAFDIPRAKLDSENPKRDVQRLLDDMRENNVYAERITRKYICQQTGMTDASANIAVRIAKHNRNGCDLKTILDTAIRIAENASAIMKHTYGSQHRAPMRVARTRLDIGDKLYMMSRGTLYSFEVSKLTVLADRVDVTVRCLDKENDRWTITYDAEKIDDYMHRDPDVARRKGGAL